MKINSGEKEEKKEERNLENYNTTRMFNGVCQAIKSQNTSQTIIADDLNNDKAVP